MVAPLQSDYSNRKGIYKDLYREIDANNHKKESLNVRKSRKGIYVELYKQIDFEKQEKRSNQNNLYFLAFKKLVKDIFSRISYVFSAASREIKMLILAYVVAKKPINSYIGNNLQTYQNQGQNLGRNLGQSLGIYYNDR